MSRTGVAAVLCLVAGCAAGGGANLRVPVQSTAPPRLLTAPPRPPREEATAAAPVGSPEVAAASSTPDAAEPAADAGGGLVQAPHIRGTPSFGHQLEDKMTFYGDELGLHLSAATFDHFNLKFDGHSKIARLKLETGSSSSFGLRIDGDVAFKSGYARVASSVDLALAGRHLKLDLPQFDMVPESYQGHKYVELRVPVIDWHF